jgi:hypothetical protein
MRFWGQGPDSCLIKLSGRRREAEGNPQAHRKPEILKPVPVGVTDTPFAFIQELL